MLVKPTCFQFCDKVNSLGNYIDTATYDSVPFPNNMNLQSSIDDNIRDFHIEHFDYSRITKLNYISKPKRFQFSLYRGGPPKDHFLEYILDGTKYSIAIDTKYTVSQIIYNVCQYDATRFVFSMCMESQNRKFRTNHTFHHCVVMIDFEELSRRRFLGLKF